MQPMTPAAKVMLRHLEIPQQFAVCLSNDEWDHYELGAERIDRSMYCDQLVDDLRDYATEGTGRWAIRDIGGYIMQHGKIVDLIGTEGRRLPFEEGSQIRRWLNLELRRQRPPRVAISEDGGRLRILHDDLHTDITRAFVNAMNKTNPVASNRKDKACPSSN